MVQGRKAAAAKAHADMEAARAAALAALAAKPDYKTLKSAVDAADARYKVLQSDPRADATETNQLAQSLLTQRAELKNIDAARSRRTGSTPRPRAVTTRPSSRSRLSRRRWTRP